jgi:predicted Zn-dependent protease
VTPVPAIHYDGQTADGEAVQIGFEAPDLLCVASETVTRRYPLGSVTGEPALGSAHRFLLLPDGSICEYEADAADTAWLASLVPGTRSAAARIERRPFLAVAATVLVIAGVWGSLSWGADTVAKVAAARIPVTAELEVARTALATADRTFLSPSHLPAATQAQVAGEFRRLVNSLPEASCYQLHFRSSRSLGANAFALPGCNIVLLDGLVMMAGNRDEVTAVLAHEAGHVREHHAMRGTLHSSLTLMILSLVTGDAPPGSLLLATGPGFLLQTAYSRDLEREADRAAVELLNRRGIPPSRLGDLLARLEARQTNGDNTPNFLSSHPLTSDRIRQTASTPAGNASKRASR